ncbi:GNAT family N-acetyltransferase [Lujinxingia sediminis]|uniref:GNAT family N-acetyltransferase n=2 Tax=Lujinxingia sediminis TaxID=2480984 RepID=A0ABY0CPD4_9DELT|nr:GNAT family N-acetyltransferase [Lujinxingia sediminis]
MQKNFGAANLFRWCYDLWSEDWQGARECNAAALMFTRGKAPHCSARGELSSADAPRKLESGRRQSPAFVAGGVLTTTDAASAFEATRAAIFFARNPGPLPDGVRRGGRATEVPPMAVEELTERDELREFLVQDRLANAYLLGNLDPSYFQFCRWYGSRDERGEIANLMLVYRGLSLPVVFTSGRGEDLPDFLKACYEVVPERFHFHVLETQMADLNSTFEVGQAEAMIRMGLERRHFEPGVRDERVERLGHRDTAQIMALYEHYPDNFFEPYQLETGLYFGIRDEEGDLVSIAGVHVVSEAHDIAVIGNLVTHSGRRGQGLATACTARLLEELFERVSLVALNVQVENAPAIRMYENFGFRANNRFYEGRWSKAAERAGA